MFDLIARNSDLRRPCRLSGTVRYAELTDRFTQVRVCHSKVRIADHSIGNCTSYTLVCWSWSPVDALACRKLAGLECSKHGSNLGSTSAWRCRLGLSHTSLEDNVYQRCTLWPRGGSEVSSSARGRCTVKLIDGRAWRRNDPRGAVSTGFGCT